MKLFNILFTLVLSLFFLSSLSWSAEPSHLPPQKSKTGVTVIKPDDKILMIPDLKVMSVTVSPSSPQEGDIIGPITVTVKNRGGAAAGPNTAVIGCIGSNCFPIKCTACNNFVLETSTSGIGWSYKWTLPTLGPNQSATFTFTAVQIPSAPSLPPLPRVWKAGNYAFIAVVDRDHAISELSENNNSLSISVNVPAQ